MGQSSPNTCHTLVGPNWTSLHLTHVPPRAWEKKAAFKGPNPEKDVILRSPAKLGQSDLIRGTFPHDPINREIPPFSGQELIITAYPTFSYIRETPDLGIREDFISFSAPSPTHIQVLT